MDNVAVQQDTPLTDMYDVNTNDFAQPVSPEVASARAVRAQYALTNILPKPVDEIQDAIQQGNETSLRNETAAALDARKLQDTQAQIVQIASKPTVTPEDQQKIYTLATTQKPSDPRSVFEDSFATNFVNKIYTVNGTTPYTPKFSWLDDAIQLIPDVTQKYVDLATVAVAKNLYSRQMEEDAGEALHAQPWFGSHGSPVEGYAVDLIKNLSTLYPQIKLRGSVKGSDFITGTTLVDVLDNLRIQLNRLPYEEYKTEYKRVLDKLKYDNPMLAVQFAKGMTGLSSDEAALSNMVELGGVMPVLEGIQLAGLGFKAIRLANQTKNLASSMVRASAHVGEQPPPVAAAAGVGDLTEAAVQKSSVVIQEQLAGAPNETKRAIEALTSNFRVDMAGVEANPGRFGQDVVNRIHDSYTSGMNSLVSAIVNWNRVNRTPVAVSSEQVSRAIADSLKGDLKGINNAILDVHGPVAEPVSNTHVYEFKIGNSNGEYYKDRQTALNNAKLNGLTIRPSVSQRINEINQEIGKIVREVKTEVDRNGFVKVEGESKAAGVKFGEEPPKPANSNASARILELRAERDQLAKVPAEERTRTPVPRTEGFTVEQKDSGAGWYINVTKFLPETGDITRDSLITTKYDSIGAYRAALQKGELSTSIPPVRFGFIGSYLSKFRTPEETLSAQERAARRLSVSTTTKVLQLLDQNKLGLNNLPFKYYKDLDRVLEANQHMKDPVTGKSGYFFKGPGDLDAWYQKYLKRPVSEHEVAAYFDMKKVVEFDRVFREMDNFRNRARAGVESHSIKIQNSMGETVQTPFFDGIRMHNFPGGEDTIMILGKKLGDEKFYKANAVPPSIKPDYVKDVIEGTKRVFRVWNPEDFPFEGFSDLAKGKKVRYVVFETDSETRPLSWSSINRTGGGHLTPDYQMYIKQPIMHREFVGNNVTDHYHGDATFAPIADRAVGDAVVKDMNTVRELLHEGKIEEAKAAHLNSKSLPMDWDEHLGYYQAGRSPEGKPVPARFNTRVPFQVVPKDTLIVDIDNTLQNRFNFRDADGNIKNTFKDGTRSGSDARMSAIEFTGARDAYDLKTITREIGTQGNPVFSFQPVKYIDPITAMDRGLSRIVNTTIADDYKISAMEHWLQNAHMHLNADITELRSAPQYWFNKAEYLPGTPPAIKWMLENNRQRIKDFTGVASEKDAALARAAQTLSDSIYGATGSSKLSMVPVYMWPYIKDPIQYIRSWTYHAMMGFYNINTFFTQFASHVNIAALSPRHASSGTMAMMLYGMSSFNKSEAVLDGLDKLASTFNNGLTKRAGITVGWKPGWWKEAAQELEKSGFAVVGHENAFLDTSANINILRGMTKNAPVAAVTDAAGKIIDTGLTPFRLGSGTTRASGWFVSYLEWKQANPTKYPDRFDIEKIIQRADLLDANMSRASASTLHTGLMSVPFQFAAYSMRVSEQLTGKRLTSLEKARLFAANVALFGTPVGVGVTGIPLGDYLYKQVKDKLNYVPGEGAASTSLMEGGLTMLAAFISGGGDWKKGDLYDFSRWGTKGVETFDTAVAADKTFWDVIGGAPYSKMKDVVNLGTPMVRAITSMMIKDDPNFPKAWTVTSNDLIDMGRILSAGDKLAQTIIAVNTGKWKSKNEIYVADVDKSTAFFLGITGVNLTEAHDMYNKQDWIKTQDKLYKDAEAQFGKEWRRYVENDLSGNKEAAEKHASNAWATLYAVDFPSEKYSEAITRAMKGLGPKIKDVNWTYYTRQIPTSRAEDKLNTLYKQDTVNEQRGRQK